MIRAIIFLFLFLFASFQGICQILSTDTGPEPKGGINKLALEYYKINFTKEQRKTLEGIELEFMYLIDEQGIPTLQKINGVDDQAVLDSLYQITSRLPGFYPRKIDDEIVSSIYFLKFQFPAYRVTENSLVFQNGHRYWEAKYEDFEYIRRSGERIDLMIGGMTNFFLGNPAHYLYPGGGMKMDLMYSGKKGIGGGLVMGFYGNKFKQNYPINSTRNQNPAPPTMLIGVAGSKIIWKQERKEFNLQAELNLAIQNITPRLSEADQDWVQLNGVSPGMVGNYLIQLGKNRTSYSYGSPAIIHHYLNFYGSVRPVLFNLKAATGVMLDVGIAYRMGIHAVDEYRLKPEFREK